LPHYTHRPPSPVRVVLPAVKYKKLAFGNQ
jgi:hypothetical protein